MATLLTVTNATDDPLSSDVSVRFRYISARDAAGNPVGCTRTEISEELTPFDTLTVVTNAHVQTTDQGFVYAFAESGATQEPISHNHLIGSLLVIDGLLAAQYSVNPFSFQSPVSSGGTDLDLDGELDLDGLEYELAPDRIIVPRFIGQDALHQSELILISLKAGAALPLDVGFSIFNDNEEEFAAEYIFSCWDRVSLTAISGAFHNQFLLNSTNTAINEIVGYPSRVAGWIEVNGLAPPSPAPLPMHIGSLVGIPGRSLADQAILAVLVEKTAIGVAADLPFAIGQQVDGNL